MSEALTRPEVVCELRSLFKEGATPSRLIRHIAERHSGEARLHLLTHLYFQEAFGIPIVRDLNPIDAYQQADLRYAFLNEQLIQEMVQKREEWDAANGLASGERASWLDTLTASDHQQRLNRIQATAIPELSRCWPQLTADEQHYIQRSLATANGLYETVKILSRLVECLQQRLIEEEAKC